METQVKIPTYPANCRSRVGQYHIPVGEIDKILEVFGWQFSAEQCADGWRHATPPNGWSALPHNGSLVLIDDMGRKRLEVAITATSYSYVISPYFTIDSRKLPNGGIQAWVASPDNPRLHVVQGPEKEVREAIHSWLNKHFPGWTNPANWWDTSPTTPQ